MSTELILVKIIFKVFREEAVSNALRYYSFDRSFCFSRKELPITVLGGKEA